MKITPYMRAKRAFKNTDCFELRASIPDELASLLSSQLSLDSVIGCYANGLVGSSFNSLVVLTEECICVFRSTEFIRVLYSDILEVRFPGGSVEKNIDAKSLEIVCGNSDVIKLPVEGGNEMLGTRDTFTMSAFLDHVIGDIARNNKQVASQSDS